MLFLQLIFLTDISTNNNTMTIMFADYMDKIINPSNINLNQYVWFYSISEKSQFYLTIKIYKFNKFNISREHSCNHRKKLLDFHWVVRTKHAIK